MAVRWSATFREGKIKEIADYDVVGT